MFTSTALSVVFTGVFAVTGVYSLVRLAQLLAGESLGGDRIVELFHLVMSLGMVAMTWSWTGGPATAGGGLQVAVFGVFTAWFVHRAVTRVTGHGPVANGYHVVMGAAMTWMVAAMPQMMGMGSAGGHSGHQGTDGGMAGMPGMSGPVEAGQTVPSPPPPSWVAVVSVVLVVLLLLAAGWWAVRAVRAEDPDPGRDVVGGGTATATRIGTASTARSDACCHVLMSVGMAGMLAAML